MSHVTLYSDTCGGQNKNTHLVAMLMAVLKNHPTLKIIDHKFLLAGHTRMECDSDHALIEKKKKNSNVSIYHPHDCLQLVRQTGKKKPFRVIQMERKDFYEYSSLFLSLQVKNVKNNNGEKLKWRPLKWLRYSKADLGLLQYKDTLDVSKPFKFLKLLKQGQARTSFIPPLTYTKPVPITEAKKKDLLSLLQFIPTVFHDIYKNLSTEKSQKDKIFVTIDEEEYEED